MVGVGPPKKKPRLMENCDDDDQVQDVMRVEDKSPPIFALSKCSLVRVKPGGKPLRVEVCPGNQPLEAPIPVMVEVAVGPIKNLSQVPGNVEVEVVHSQKQSQSPVVVEVEPLKKANKHPGLGG